MYKKWPGQGDSGKTPLIPNFKAMPEDFDYQGEIRSHLEGGYSEVVYALLDLYDGPDKADFVYMALQKAHLKGRLLEDLHLYGIGVSKCRKIFLQQRLALPPDHPESYYQAKPETTNYAHRSLRLNVPFMLRCFEFSYEHGLPLTNLDHITLDHGIHCLRDVQAYTQARTQVGKGPIGVLERAFESCRKL